MFMLSVILCSPPLSSMSLALSSRSLHAFNILSKWRRKAEPPRWNNILTRLFPVTEKIDRYDHYTHFNKRNISPPPPKKKGEKNFYMYFIIFNVTVSQKVAFHKLFMYFRNLYDFHYHSPVDKSKSSIAANCSSVMSWSNSSIPFVPITLSPSVICISSPNSSFERF